MTVCVKRDFCWSEERPQSATPNVRSWLRVRLCLCVCVRANNRFEVRPRQQQDSLRLFAFHTTTGSTRDHLPHGLNFFRFGIYFWCTLRIISTHSLAHCASRDALISKPIQHTHTHSYGAPHDTYAIPIPAQGPRYPQSKHMEFLSMSPRVHAHTHTHMGVCCV